MTLRETLKKYKGKRVKIFSGVSFFYCGKVDSKIIKTIKEIGEEYVAYWNKSLNFCFLKQHSKKIGKKVKKRYLTKAKNLQKRIDEFVPFLKREVLEEYPSISYDELDTTIIHIVGEEYGKYWTCKEYQKAMKKKGKKVNVPKAFDKLRIYK